MSLGAALESGAARHNRGMSVTAAQLSRSGANAQDLDAFTQTCMRVVEDALNRHPRHWGRNVVTVELPTTPPAGLPKADTQRITYAAVLRSLMARGFETKIQIDDDTTLVYAAWDIEVSEEELAAMNTLIRSCRIRPDEVDQFRRAGAARPHRRSKKEPAPATPAAPAAPALPAGPTPEEAAILEGCRRKS